MSIKTLKTNTYIRSEMKIINFNTPYGNLYDKH